jgi:uncharacterized membrane protein
MAASKSARRRAADSRSGGNRSRTGQVKPGQNGTGAAKAHPKNAARGGGPARPGDRRQGRGGGSAVDRPKPEELANGAGPGRLAQRATPALWLQIATLVIAIVGLVDSIYITIQEETGGALAGCTAKTGLVDCAAVIHSPESVILGIPVAALGIVFFAFMIAIMSPWAWRSARREIWQLRVASLVVGMGFVIYLLYAELFEVGNICAYCTSVHILTFLLFVLTMVGAAIWGAPPRSGRAEAR